MPHTLGRVEIQALLAALGGDYDINLPGGVVRLLARSLPGDAVCALLDDIGDGVTRIVYDLGKPLAVLHVQAMVREYWESQWVAGVLPRQRRTLLPHGPAHVTIGA